MTKKELNYKYNCICEDNNNLSEKLERMARSRDIAEKIADSAIEANDKLAEDIKAQDELLDKLFMELSVISGIAIAIRKEILNEKKRRKTVSTIKEEEKENG